MNSCYFYYCVGIAAVIAGWYAYKTYKSANIQLKQSKDNNDKLFTQNKQHNLFTNFLNYKNITFKRMLDYNELMNNNVEFAKEMYEHGFKPVIDNFKEGKIKLTQTKSILQQYASLSVKEQNKFLKSINNPNNLSINEAKERIEEIDTILNEITAEKDKIINQNLLNLIGIAKKNLHCVIRIKELHLEYVKNLNNVKNEFTSQQFSLLKVNKNYDEVISFDNKKIPFTDEEIKKNLKINHWNNIKI